MLHHKPDPCFKSSVFCSMVIAMALFFCAGFLLQAHAVTGSYTDPDNGATYTYNTTQTGTTITGCENIPASGELVIPGQLGEGLTTDMIGMFAFSGKAGLKRVVFPDTLKAIDHFAFRECYDLEEIQLPQHLTSIGEDAFSFCGLLEVVLPNSLQTLGRSAFGSCQSLQKVTLSNQLTAIGDSTFYRTAIKKIEIPASVTSIDGTAFSNCSSLEQILVDQNNPNYKTLNDTLFTKTGTSLVVYPSARGDGTYHIPDGVTEICKNAFAGTRTLQEIVLSDSVINIGDQAFANCGNLHSLRNSPNLQTIGLGAFMNCTKLTGIDLPDTLTLLDTYAFAGSGLTSLTIPGGVNEIKELIVNNCESLETVVIKEGASKINDYAFLLCPNLRSVTIPASVNIIGDMAIENVGGDLPKGQTFTIIGEPSSAAERYAEKKGIAFAIQKDPVIPVKQVIMLARPAFAKTLGERPFNLQAKAKTTLTYKSSDPSVATVSADGKVILKGLGKTKITITASASEQYLAASATVPIQVKLATPVVKAKNLRPRQVKLSWSKTYGASGYEVYVKCPGEKRYHKRLTRSAKVKSVTHVDLKKHRTYRYKIRAFKKVNGKKYYSKFSHVQKVKIRK